MYRVRIGLTFHRTPISRTGPNLPPTRRFYGPVGLEEGRDGGRDPRVTAVLLQTQGTSVPRTVAPAQSGVAHGGPEAVETVHSSSSLRSTNTDDRKWRNRRHAQR